MIHEDRVLHAVLHREPVQIPQLRILLPHGGPTRSVTTGHVQPTPALALAAKSQERWI